MFRVAQVNLIVVAWVLTLPSPPAEAQGWEFQDEDDGVTVYTRQVEGVSVEEVRAITSMNCSPDLVWETLTNPDNRIKLMPMTVESRQVSTCGDTCIYVYERLSSTGIDDRHYILKLWWSVTRKGGVNQYHVKFSTSPDRVPESLTDTITITNMNGSWKLRSINEGTGTRFTYQSLVDLEGDIPTFIVNSASIDAAIDLLHGVRMLCE